MNKKGAGTFTMLDLWVTLIFIAAIIILLIYVNFVKVEAKEKIEANIMGTNFPHYFLNALENHQFNINSTCPEAPNQDLNFIDYILWLDSACAENPNSLNVYNVCFQSLNLELQNVRDDLLSSTNVNSYIEISGGSFNTKKIVSYGSQDIADLARSLNNYFVIQIPGQNKNVNIEFYFLEE
jgi:hypothetical protein